MRVKTTPRLSSTETVPSASAMALWNDVCPGSAVRASPSAHWLFAYAQTQYGVSSVMPPATALPLLSFP